MVTAKLWWAALPLLWFQGCSSCENTGVWQGCCGDGVCDDREAIEAHGPCDADCAVEKLPGCPGGSSCCGDSRCDPSERHGVCPLDCAPCEPPPPGAGSGSGSGSGSGAPPPRPPPTDARRLRGDELFRQRQLQGGSGSGGKGGKGPGGKGPGGGGESGPVCSSTCKPAADGITCTPLYGSTTTAVAAASGPPAAADADVFVGVGIGAAVLLIGCVCAVMKYKKMRLRPLDSLGNYLSDMLSAREYCRSIGEACTAALKSVDIRASTFARPSETFQPPAELPRAQQLKHVLSKPEQLLKVGRSTFKNTVATAIAFIDDYIDATTQWWSTEEIQEVATGKVGTAFVDTYSSVHDLIRAKEEEGYTAYKKEMKNLLGTCIPYESKIDQIEDKAERITELYVQASQVLPHFRKLIEHVAKTADGSAIVAPLKSPLRVVEKMALRPEKGVPWDIVRAQIQVESMADVSKTTFLLSDAPEVDVHRIKDRFSNPHEGGWADCSMSMTMNFDPDAIGKSGNVVTPANLGKESKDSLATVNHSNATTHSNASVNQKKLQNCTVMCEVQVVHGYLMMVREGMKQHDSYDHGRFAAELLTTRGGGLTPPLPWSVREKLTARESAKQSGSMI